jgi:hypothetical protein
MGKNGIIVPKNDAMAIFNALKFLIEDEVKLGKISESNRTLNTAPFQVENIIKKLYVIYSEIVEPVSEAASNSSD